ncbi:hypothetical protein BH24GEM2_BH24GEM2_04010 [soil metagenome]|jgi:hypothetical protein|nr:hypothetical protein [Gemmatimonadota bacterium]
MSVPAASDASGSRYTFDEPALAEALRKHMRVQQDLGGGGYILIHQVGDLYYTGSVVHPGYTTVFTKAKTLAGLLEALQTASDEMGYAG